VTGKLLPSDFLLSLLIFREDRSNSEAEEINTAGISVSTVFVRTY